MPGSSSPEKKKRRVALTCVSSSSAATSGRTPAPDSASKSEAYEMKIETAIHPLDARSCVAFSFAGDATASFFPEFTHQVFHSALSFVSYENDGEDEEGEPMLTGFMDVDIRVTYTALWRALICVRCDPDHCRAELLNSALLPWFSAATTDDNQFALWKDEDDASIAAMQSGTARLSAAAAWDAHFSPPQKVLSSGCLEIIAMSTRSHQELHGALEAAAVWFIEGASSVDSSDDAWSLLVAMERGKVVGYVTLFAFYNPITSTKRVRICQMVVLPPFQRRGYGREMLQCVRQLALHSADVSEITVEDPCPGFSRLRDAVDLGDAMRLRSENLVATVEEIRSKLKITKGQAARCNDMLRWMRVRDAEDESERSTFRLDFKRRLYRALGPAEDKEKRKQHLASEYSKTIKEYEKAVASAQKSTRSSTQKLRLIEHVNLNIPAASVELATRFYIDGLGGKLHPVNTNGRQLHVNLGLSQFHLPYLFSMQANRPVTTAQAWSGAMDLVTTEDLKDVRMRLGDIEEVSIFSSEDSNVLCFKGPFGNSFRLTSSPQSKPASHHLGGSSTLIAMSTLVHFVKPGRAKAIGRFYSQVLGLDVEHLSGRIAVPTSCDQRLEFVEDEDRALDPDAYDANEACAYHIAVYFSTHQEYLGAYARAEKHGAVWVNERFCASFSAETCAEAHERCQFRVKDLRDPETGALGMVLEHELRSPRHASCPFR